MIFFFEFLALCKTYRNYGSSILFNFVFFCPFNLFDWCVTEYSCMMKIDWRVWCTHFNNGIYDKKKLLNNFGKQIWFDRYIILKLKASYITGKGSLNVQDTVPLTFLNFGNQSFFGGFSAPEIYTLCRCPYANNKLSYRNTEF